MYLPPGAPVPASPTAVAQRTPAGTQMNRQALELSPVQRYLEQLHAELLQTTGGEVASYIPELTHADPSLAGHSPGNGG